MAMAASLAEQGAELYAKNLKFVEEEIRIHGELRPRMATPNTVRLDLRTMKLREYGKPGGGLGRRLSLKNIACPVYLLAGEADDITAKEQVFAAEKYVGTPNDKIVKQLVPGGHIGLFMGSRALTQAWPAIARWIIRQ